MKVHANFISARAARLGLILLMGLIAAGCAGTTQEAIPTGKISPARSPTPEGWLYHDDFADPDSGWAKDEDDKSRVGYHEPHFYHVEVKRANQSKQSFPGKSFNDFSVETSVLVDKTQTTTGDFRYGLAFRRAGERYYTFTISPRKQTWRVTKRTASGENILIKDSEDNTINSFASEDLLRVDARGSDFVFYINGHKVGEMRDAEYASGDIGFNVETLDERLAHIHFNFITIKRVGGLALSQTPLPGARPTAAQATLTPTRAITPTISPSPTLPIPPGVYVTQIRLEPEDPTPAQEIRFIVSFLNNTGRDVDFNWCVYIYRLEEPLRGIGQTACRRQSVPMEVNEIRTINTWRPGPGACRIFRARVVATYPGTQTPEIEFKSTNGQPFEHEFRPKC